ncbi:hypothetical protein [Elstera litoralis]|uniref:hypothetical protein n=1 Tax=Elstera litoralis TaxID=552518 RepID=UPI001E4DC971|nr:hypothetical protein [Elstera litoralis]
MSTAITPRLVDDASPMPRARWIGGGLLGAILLFGLLGPLLTIDPQAQNLRAVLLPPGSAEAWLGTDHLGRSCWPGSPMQPGFPSSWACSRW